VIHGRAGAVIALALTAAGCEDERPDATPERVVAELVDRMQRVHGERGAARDAVELLAAPARENLAERARRATHALGRPVGPEEMLAPSRFSLSFQPRTYGAEIAGQYAIVTVRGEGLGEEAQVRCQLEDGAWRVVLDLPDLPAVRTR